MSFNISSIEQNLISAANTQLAQTKPFPVACAVMVAYDYVLNVDLERKKFTLVSWIYIMLRWLSLAFVLIEIGTPVWVTSNYLATIITLLLQGIMTLRVYILLGKSRKILSVLLTSFTIAQAVNIGSALLMIKLLVAPNDDPLGSPLMKWSIIVYNAIMMAFEAILCGLVVYHGAKKTQMTSQTKSSNVYTMAVAISEAFLYGVVGPWMILSLRSRDEKTMNSQTSQSLEVSVVNFSHTQDSYIEEEV
ncbi:hypothetical protein CONPUDRAFT_75385 [Coniophora puteana RWD-64-598 SS2]|uniref:Uncharacterized protein n=1 Tax=Coniophora puteana (strain RWD-64-598) TaxID=741705 RepID=A0A5M3MFZ8_CONPW|nr:uncharacterized protein CONPUDRAFT_75385 [Coniophora puteana RWD-64-598 SS2]EIW77521.1 hypothetical protein CONPUDRAFT_75385 [Coniophora puteana RWD-64-598 SS2]